MQEPELTEVVPFICILAVRGQYPVFFTSGAPLELTAGSGCSLLAAGSTGILPEFPQGTPAHLEGL